ncbi:MAG: Nif3-like dinuclear metal center hexameric protein [Devosiaceae bacterium]|nr:Nif3-like dinuclear metal center hexameric protein [Devosiaceae bacterium]
MPRGSEEAGYGLGRVGSYSEPVSVATFIDRLKSACNPPWLLSAGKIPDTISKVAVCGGSCSELADKAQLAGAQVFITAEVKHNIARWAEETGFWIIDAGHFATENTGIQHFAGQLATETASRFEKINIEVTGSQFSPLTLM